MTDDDFDLYGALATASSLWAGMVYVHGERGILAAWNCGCMELHYEMARVAKQDFELCGALFDAAPKDWPGAYLYEVTEVLGDWIGKYLLDNERLPDAAALQAKHRELALAFFPDECHALITPVLDKHLPLTAGPAEPSAAEAHALSWPDLYFNYHGELA